MSEALFAAVDFVRHELRIPVSQLLPYPGMLVPLSYFFHAIKHKKPTKTQRALLEQWVYWTAYNYRYSSGAEAKIVDDLNRMDRIVEEKQQSYRGEEIHVDPLTLVDWGFSTSDAFCKLILCLYAYNEPKSFDSDGIVNLDNSNLKIASSRNYHHFFPKAYIAKNFRGANPNLMVNITLIDGYSNKHRIRDKAPSQYIAKFEKENENMDATLRSHLIGNREAFGINDNDYDTFLKMRSREIARQLNRKLDPFKTRGQNE
jgi:hypothetical protein